jgi:hypothetical protein
MIQMPFAVFARYGTIESLYVKARAARAQAVWDEVALGSGATGTTQGV